MRARRYQADKENDDAIPGDAQADVARARGELLEAMADFDDHLMEELLEGIEPPLDEIEKDLCEECSHDQIVPVLVAAGRSSAGVPALVRAMEKMVPVAGRRPEGRRRRPPDRARPERAVVAHVIKTSIHPQSGKLSIVRTLSGTRLSPTRRSPISARATRRFARGGLYRLQGKKQKRSRRPAPPDRRDRPAETVHTGDVHLERPQGAVAARAVRRANRSLRSRSNRRIASTRRRSRRCWRASSTKIPRCASNAPRSPTNYCCWAAASARVDRHRAAGAQVQSRSRDGSAGNSVHRDDHGRNRNPLALQAPDRRPRPIGDVWLRFEAASARQRRDVRGKSSAASSRASSFPRSKGRTRSAPASRAGTVTDVHVTLRRRVSRRRFERAIVQDRREHGRARSPAEVRPGGARADRARQRVGSDDDTSTVIQQLTGKRGQILE